MKSIFATLCLFAALAFGAVEVDESGVLVLTDKTFDEAIAQNDVLLVKFYAPWCGHCKTLAPEYEKAAQELEGTPAKLAKMDATENKEQSEKHGIRGFPTLKFFKNGKVSEYSGGRTAPDIVSWMTKKSGPVTKSVATTEDLSALQEAHNVFVLGAFDAADSAAAKEFASLAGSDEVLSYAVTTEKSVKESLGITADTVIIMKTFDDKRNDLDISAGFDTAAVSQFIAGNSVPLVQTFSQESAKEIFASPIKTHILFFTNAESEHHAPTLSTMTDLAKEFKGKNLFINVPHSEKRVLDYFGITDANLPTLVLAEMGDDQMKKFPFSGEMTAESVKSFIDDFHSGTLVPNLKSEEVAADDTTGDVVTLRGKSFNELVIDNDNDVLVKFYAPWCGHCKKLAPVFDEVGASLKSNPKIIVAKMDSTGNEINVPGVVVKGYPTLYFFKGDDKSNPVKYEGGRETNDFIEYLQENAHNAVAHDEL